MAGLPETRPRPGLASGLAGALFFAAVAVALTQPLDGLDEPLTLLLACAALLANILAKEWELSVDLSATFVCCSLVAALVGPAPAVAVVVAAELGTWLWRRSRAVALVVNVAGLGAPILAAGIVIREIAPRGTADEGTLLAALAGASVLTLLLNWLIVSSLGAIADGYSQRAALRVPAELLPAIALTVGFAVVLAAAYLRLGLAAAATVFLLVVGFGYLAGLVRVARERTREYASLSWGVLSGLVRTLDRRDGRTARHSAAVAAFSRDIAAQAGLDRREQELAHTAGLLHDIGKFAFGDRVLDRGSLLTEDDWEAVQQHPVIGADLLQDLGVYGPVAELVRAHHERVDGRGYPDGLAGDEIPEIARIVAVAEVYDTLTAEDTYRTPMTSFEALRELRRVTGTQLDPRYVEALAELLTGRGVEYRHADQADFAHELAMERRIAEAVTPASCRDRSAGAG